MLDAIGAVAPYGIGLAVAAAPVAVLALLLATSRPVAVGAAFAGGWVAGIVLAAGVVVAVADLTDVGPRRTAVEMLRLVAGLALCALAMRSWRKRGTGGTPAWMDGVGGWSAGRASTIGLALGALNPKNLVLVVAAAGALVETTPRVAEQVAAVLALGVLGGVGVVTPVVVRVTGGTGAERGLASTGTWMASRANVLAAVVLLVLGVALTLDAARALL